ncbi:MAG: hypothetical protein KJ052_11305 [Candidatus Hydrogenedentes bacterium]|nr:hypothetical protein [Candidatus Hydrogenedentota bacterium]
MKTQETWTDPIVDELHRIRRELVEEAGGDLKALGAWLMKSQERHGDRLVTRGSEHRIDVD